jgi:hypothetical protein
MIGSAIGVATGTPWRRSGVIVIPAGGGAVEHQTLTVNNTTVLDVGNTATDMVVFIEYAASRGANYQMGSITILNKGLTTESTWNYFGDDIGLSLSGGIVGGDIVLNCYVDDSSIIGVEFNFTIEIVTL